MPASIYHPGERAVQLRAGEATIADRNAALIVPTILGGAHAFLERQFMVVLASSDADGSAWSSVLYGSPGFVHAEGEAAIVLGVPSGQRDSADPFWTNIVANPAVGMLFIELGTRRRYRINGRVIRNDQAGLEIAVREAYPNCSKYIQRRQLRDMGAGFAPKIVASGVAPCDVFTADIEALVGAADTLFVATAHPATGADASHRGGPCGFAQFIGPHTLQIPDYHGNSIFNTLGNLELDSHIGLCIPDFEGNRLLQLTGRGRLLWDQNDPGELSGGTRRFLEVAIDRWIMRQVSHHLEWKFLDASPFNPSRQSA